MNGHYNGMQTKMKEICSSVEFALCVAHSLSLVEQSALYCCVKRFDFLEQYEKYSIFLSAMFTLQVSHR